jgi:hypothetical protein
MQTYTRFGSLALALMAPAVLACDTADPSLAVLDNAYPVAAEPAAQITVYKGWWSVTEFPEPVSAGASSEDERVIPASDYAYLLLAPGWDPQSTLPPVQLIAVRSKSKLSVRRGDRLQIVVSDDTVDGHCGPGVALSQEDADVITQRIFPGDFAGVTYDAASCTTALAR